MCCPWVFEFSVGIGGFCHRTGSDHPSFSLYGIEIDSLKMESRLPMEKVVRVKDKLQGVMCRKKGDLS